MILSYLDTRNNNIQITRKLRINLSSRSSFSKLSPAILQTESAAIRPGQQHVRLPHRPQITHRLKIHKITVRQHGQSLIRARPNHHN
jgi:hypothetical protein